MRAVAVAAGLAVLALAGCSGHGAAKDPAASADFSSLGLAPTATTGVIRGIVVDEAVRPLGNVSIVARGDGGRELHGNTTAAGVFGFSNVAPGTWFLGATRPGYRPAQSSVDVVAGVAEPPAVKVVLSIDAANRPYVEAYQFEGFLECGVTTPSVSVALCLAPNEVVPNATDEKTQVTYQLTGRPRWIQTEMTWDSTQAAGDAMTLEYSYSGGCGLYCDHSVNGTSPLLLTANQTVVDAIGLGNGTGLYIRVFNDDVPGTTPPVGACAPVKDPVLGATWCVDRGVGATVEQKFVHYTHVFYGYAPPPGWRFSDGSAVPPPPA